MCYGWGSETGFFPKYFVVTHRLGKHIRLRSVLCRSAWGSETWFFPRYFVVTHRLGKHIRLRSVLCRSAWASETWFFPRYFVVTHRLGKKPGFLSECVGFRNRVFSEILRINPPRPTLIHRTKKAAHST
jgi:hypothetical protein